MQTASRRPENGGKAAAEAAGGLSKREGAEIASRRHRHGANLVYGLHAVWALLDKRPDGILAARVLRGSRAGSLPEIERRLAFLKIPVSHVERQELDRLTQGAAHQGVVVQTRGLAEIGIRELETLVLERGKSVRLLVLDQVQDPRNLGACLRTADAAAVDAVVIPRHRAAALTATAVKAATGAAESVRLARVANLASTLHWLKDAGVWIVGADAQTQRCLYDTQIGAPIAVVVGGEGRGLRRLTRELCDEIVSIPMHGTVASLNVSVAVGILLFELDRQIRARSPARRVT
ncbi:MAG TPA: 23S rRNA (guanosine(2251)-2'-O)-methyltransferase RlmB [Gammaproteobacteria bacterium]|jgi:23S rRNA (guanosine2251-2'-O)-methyltransferase